MVKLVCEHCDSVWYTSNTSSVQICDSCGKEIIRKDEYEQSDEDNKDS